MPQYDIDAELAAVQFMLMALIASHPNKFALLAEFDRLSSENQVAAIAQGGIGMTDGLRKAMKKWRDRLAPGS